jgi:DNA replication licensing factor MCM6
MPTDPTRGDDTARSITTRQSNRRSAGDALSFGDEDGPEAEESQTRARRRARTQGTVNTEVPIVMDAVGESVAESFEAFLKTYVIYASLAVLTL